MSAAGTLGGVPLSVGTVLAKKYRVERLIGEGGTGLVVGATHLQLEQKVAIKVLRTALASDEIRLRFEREARAIAQISSEHVVLVLDVGTLDDGSPFMVMEHLEGKDLARMLKESGPLSVEDAVDCMLQVCEALEEAHANGIVHRDLKPANLFVTRRDDGAPHIKVVDFGISKILDSKVRGGNEVTSAFAVLGSPRYMAPEQVRNSKEVDGRADLWSVGTVLFQLITGKHAFDAESNVAASLKVLTAEPAKLRDYAPKAPPALELVVSRCLEKDVENRWSSAGELARALEPFASDRIRESIAQMREAREAPSLNIALSVSSTSEHPPPVTRSSIPPMPPRYPTPATPVPPPMFAPAPPPVPQFAPPPPSSRRPAAGPGGVVAPSPRTSARPSGGAMPVSPRAPNVATPMHTPMPDSVRMPARIPSAPPAPTGPLGREMTTAPRAFAPPAPRSSHKGATVKLGSMPPSSRGGRGGAGEGLSTELKIAIAAGGLIAVLLVFGVLLLGKMVFRQVASSDVESTAQTSTMPPAAAPATKTRDPVVVPLDAATGTP
jgi:eukaryotic-like serine/threonine-protein kinase